MGATGSEKSTLINGMVNYILGVKWGDGFRIDIIKPDGNETTSQACSQTSEVKAYTFIAKDKDDAEWIEYTFVDTPGFGDTRGMERDKQISKKIREFILRKEITAICFVAASGNSRLTHPQRYILDSALSLFDKDMRDNIGLLVTFADNALPPVLEACIVANFPTDENGEITYSKFNSSVLYAANDDPNGFDKLFWDMGQENFEKFFKKLNVMNPASLKDTRNRIEVMNNYKGKPKNYRIFYVLI